MQQKGFSLTEITIVLFIISIITAISFPALANLLQQKDDEILSSSLANTIMFAAQEAIVRHERIGLSFNDARDTLQVFTVAQKRLAAIKLQLAGGQLYWRAYPAYRDYLLFDAVSELRSDNATIWYCRKNTILPVWALVTDQRGNVRKLLPDHQNNIKDNQGKVLLCGLPLALRSTRSVRLEG